MNDRLSLAVPCCPLFTCGLWVGVVSTGDVRYAEIQMTADGRSKGIGVVRFHSPEDARRAVSILSG